MMKREAGLVLSLMLLGIAFITPALAQNAVGGPKKQSALGGPTAQTNPVVPPSHHQSAVSSSTHPISPSPSRKGR